MDYKSLKPSINTWFEGFFQWEPADLIYKKLVDFSLSLISRVMYIAEEVISLIKKNVTQTQISCIEMTHEPQKHDTNFDHFGSKSDINGLILEVE